MAAVRITLMDGFSSVLNRADVLARLFLAVPKAASDWLFPFSYSTMEVTAMRFRILAPTFSLLAALTLTFAGCNRESPKGGPGADKANKGAATSGSSDKTETFSIKVPAGHTNVTQGGQTEVSISVSRGSNFDQDVTLTFKPHDGITVTPDSWTAKKGDDTGKMVVKAADTATVGTTNIQVTGTPKTGAAATVDLGIDVKKKS
jgi:hypothetical protein